MHAGKLLLLERPEKFLKSKNEKAMAYLETLRVSAGSVQEEAP
jgi:hypothetical protein